MMVNVVGICDDAIVMSPPHPALFFDRFRLMKVNSHGRLSFALLCLETSDELCWCFVKGSVGMACRRSAMCRRVRPKVLCFCGHSREQNPPAIQSAQETTTPTPPPARCRWLATLHSGLRRLGAAPMVQHCDRSELKGTHLGVFQQRYLVHQLVLATPAAAPTDQPILSQADWCAVQALARCELGLVPVFYTGEGVRVCSGEVAVE